MSGLPLRDIVEAGEIVFVSGQLGHQGGVLVDGDVRAEVRQALANLADVLQGHGLSLTSVVKSNVYLVDMADFGPMNEVYATVFQQEPPARTAVAVKQLPLGARFEIEAIAVRR